MPLGTVTENVKRKCKKRWAAHEDVGYTVIIPLDWVIIQLIVPLKINYLCRPWKINYQFGEFPLLFSPRLFSVITKCIDRCGNRSSHIGFWLWRFIITWTEGLRRALLFSRFVFFIGLSYIIPDLSLIQGSSFHSAVSHQSSYTCEGKEVNVALNFQISLAALALNRSPTFMDKIKKREFCPPDVPFLLLIRGTAFILFSHSISRPQCWRTKKDIL